MRIAAFTRYGPRAASTRQRFLQYFPALKAAGIEVEHFPLFDDDYVSALVEGDLYPCSKVAAAYARRFRWLAASQTADLLWVYIELLPYLPAAVERLAAGGTRIVYDIDDAFFHTYDQSRDPLVRAVLGRKHGKLLDHAAACVCGNGYLREFAIGHCSLSIVVPTVVDTDQYVPVPSNADRPLTIGWIGSPSTWVGVRPILPSLREMAAKHGARILVVGAGHAARADHWPEMELRDWSNETEISDIQEMDIGIMPLLDRPFERGKSGYKLIQYMACRLPVVASPVGVNREIVKHGVNGFLASTENEWRDSLRLLLSSAALRKQFGSAGRSQAVESFSLASQAPNLIELFESLA